MSTTSVPYPPVFHDWQYHNERVATVGLACGVGVEMLIAPHRWKRVILTEDDACLLAASLLELAGEPKLAKRVLNR